MKANNKNNTVIETIVLLSDSDDEKEQTTKGPFVPRPHERLGRVSLAINSQTNHSRPRASVSGESLPPKYEWDVQDSNWKMLSISLKDRRNRNSQPTFGNTTLSATECNLDFESHQAVEDIRGGSSFIEGISNKEPPESLLAVTVASQPVVPVSRPRSQSPTLVSAKLPKLITNDGSSFLSNIQTSHKSNQYLQLISDEWTPTLTQFPPVSHLEYYGAVTEKETPDLAELPDSSSFSDCDKAGEKVMQEKGDSNYHYLDFIAVEKLTQMEETEATFSKDAVEMQSCFISSTTSSILVEKKTHKEDEDKRREGTDLSHKAGYEESVMARLPLVAVLPASAAGGTAADTDCEINGLSACNTIESKDNSNIEFQVQISDSSAIVMEDNKCAVGNPESRIFPNAAEEDLMYKSLSCVEMPDLLKRKKLSIFQADSARKRIIKSKSLSMTKFKPKDSWGSWIRKKKHCRKFVKTVQDVTKVIDLKRILKRKNLKQVNKSYRSGLQASSHNLHRTSDSIDVSLSSQRLISPQQFRSDEGVSDTGALIDEVLNQPESVHFDASYSYSFAGGGGADDFVIVGDDFYPEMPELVPQIPLVLSSFVSHSPVDDIFEKMEDCPSSTISSVDENQAIQNIEHFTSSQESEKIVTGVDSDRNNSNLSSVSSEVSSVDRRVNTELLEVKTEKLEDSTAPVFSSFAHSSTSPVPSPDSFSSRVGRVRGHKRRGRKITPACLIVLNQFLEENGTVPIPLEVSELCSQTGLHTSVIQNWFKRKQIELQGSPVSFSRETNNFRNNRDPPVDCSFPAAAPMYRKKSIITITLSDSEDEHATPNSSSRVKESFSKVQSVCTSAVVDSLTAIKRLDLDNLQCLFNKSINSLLTIVHMQTEESSLYELIRQETAHLQDILDSFSVFTATQLANLDCWLSNAINKYKKEVGEPQDPQDTKDLISTLTPWRVVTMYAAYTEKLLTEAVHTLEELACCNKHSWRIPVKVDTRIF